MAIIIIKPCLSLSARRNKGMAGGGGALIPVQELISKEVVEVGMPVLVSI